MSISPPSKLDLMPTQRRKKIEVSILLLSLVVDIYSKISEKIGLSVLYHDGESL